MKKILILFSLALMSITAAFAQTDVEADFSATCPSGQVLYYKIVDYGEVNVWYQNQYPEMLGGHIVIPRSVRYDDQTFIVTGIADGAFSNCIRMQGVEMPTTMFYIGDNAFHHCTDLRVVLMPKTLSSIGDNAFEGCSSLVDVVMPDAVVELGAYAFKDCVSIRHFVISHNLNEIPEGAFMNCKSVTDYFIPASVTVLGCNAFDGYEKLKEVYFFGSEPPMPECEDALSFGREIPIYSTKKAFDAYKASYVWGQYTIKTM